MLRSIFSFSTSPAATAAMGLVILAYSLSDGALGSAFAAAGKGQARNELARNDQARNNQEGQLILRSEAVLQDATIRLGDLFDNAGNKAGMEVGPAPAAGKTRIFRRSELTRLVYRAGLKWRPRRSGPRVVVRRASVRVPVSFLEDELTMILEAEGAPADYELSLSGRPPVLYVAAGDPIGLQFDNLRYAKRSGRFTVLVSVNGGTQEVLRGRLIAMTYVPVLIRSLQPGEQITARDIGSARVERRRVTARTVASSRHLIGMSLRRPIRSHTPIRTGDIERHVVVERGSLVTMVISTPAMTLSARGVALDSGGKGDVIRIRNASSRMVVEGTVVSPDLVRMTPFDQVAMHQDSHRPGPVSGRTLARR